MQVAVIIPCFNVAVHVEKAVRSVWAQTHADLHIIAVDDGSTDDTVVQLQRLVNERPGMLQVLHQQHGGANAARNAGLAVTDAQYVQFLDADDVLLPGKISRQVELAALHGMPALIAGAYRNQWVNGGTSDVEPLAEAWSALIQGRAGTTSANLWSRAAVLTAGGWDVRLASSQDHELIFRMLRAGGTYAVDTQVGTIILKRSSDSISRTDPAGNWERYIALRAAIRDHMVHTGTHAHVAEAAHYLFGGIRALARYDLSKAVALRDLHLGADHIPKQGVGISRAYRLMHHVFGFRMAEASARALDILRPSRSR